MSWITDNKDSAPWTLTKKDWSGDKSLINIPKSAANNQYNEGHKITTLGEPVWTLDQSGVAITEGHNPCGVWNARPDAPEPEVNLFDLIFTQQSASKQITLPLVAEDTGGVYDFTVNWGDGSSDHIVISTDPAVTHTYDSDDLYTITITGQIEEIYLADFTELIAWGPLILVDRTSYFASDYWLTVSATDVPDLSRLIDADNFFSRCYELTEVPNIDQWEVATVESMNHFFNQCQKFNGDLDSWDVSKVTSMERMFYECYLFNSELNSWDVSKVGNFVNTFGKSRIFNQPLDSWDTSSALNLDHMFYNALLFNQNINDWDVSNVLNMTSVFHDAEAFNQPLNKWDTSKVTTMSSMFQDADKFNQSVSSWNVSNVTNMFLMFGGYGTGVFDQSLVGWDTSKVTSMVGMFRGQTSFDQDLSSWDFTSIVGSGLSNFIYRCPMSVTNYSNLLISMASQDVNSNVTFSGTRSKYSVGVATTARDYLVNDKNWSIDDGGQE